MSGERIFKLEDAPPFVFRYTNYKGETEMRRVKPEAVWYGSTSYHPDNQWFLSAWDLDRKANRNFAMKDIVLQPAIIEAAEKFIYDQENNTREFSYPALRDAIFTWRKNT